MTTSRIILLSGIALGGLGSCAGTPDGFVDYQLTGGLAGVHASVHIDRDGEVTRTKLDGNKETSRLDPTALSDLERKVEMAEFPTLEPIYGCGGCVDDFVHTISVDLDDRSRDRLHRGLGSYTVKTDGSAPYPERLRPLIETLSTMSQEPLDAGTDARYARKDEP
jgi:hypothetical protein